VQANGFQNAYEDLSQCGKAASAPPPPAPAAKCTVLVGNRAMTYDNCMPLTGLSGPMELLWTYHPSVRVLHAAFSGFNPGGWVGWGFSDTLTQDNAMVPGNAIMVKADSSAATGA
jgi:hypothetical protein